MDLQSPVDVTPSRPQRPANLGDYEATRASFRLESPERYNPVLDIVERWAQEQSDDLALVSVDGAGAVVARQTIADVARESRRAARALLDLGIGAGDRVFVMLPRTPQWYAAVLGAIRIGAVPAPGPMMLTPKDIAFRISRLGAVAAITNEAGAQKLDAAAELSGLHRICVGAEAPPQGWSSFAAACESAGDGPTPADPTAANDPMLIYFTSGTVSHPKMVLHTQASYGLGHVITARFWQDLHPGDLHWTVSDTGWAKAAWGGLFGQWHERATVMQVDLGKPDPDTILRILAEHGVNSFCAPPTLYRMLVQADLEAYDLSALRHCTSAGEPLNPEVIREWAEGTGLTVFDGYGQTETTNLVANFPGTPVKPGSMGRPTPGYVVDVVDDDGQPVPAGTVGNVVVLANPRPVGMFAGYVGDSGATEAAFHGDWYYTGDKAAKDGDGYFWFEGRSDDVITSAAYRIGPFEVESALVEHPAVAEAAVVGKPDENRTEIVTAFCILAPGYEPSPELAAELQAYVKSVTAPYKYPRELYFVDELPKTISGKIRRSQLRQELQSGAWGSDAPGHPEPR